MLDAVALTVLLLLVFTVRLGPENPVADLVPDSEAAQSKVDTVEVDTASPAGTLDLGSTTQRVGFLAIDGSAPGRTLCRVTRIGDEVETTCTRLDEAVTPPRGGKVEWVAHCAATASARG